MGEGDGRDGGTEGQEGGTEGGKKGEREWRSWVEGEWGKSGRGDEKNTLAVVWWWFSGGLVAVWWRWRCVCVEGEGGKRER